MMPKKEIVIFNDLEFCRYPESKHHGARSYYKRAKTSLHREVYKHFYGEIPIKHVIHHKDGDTFNNSIANLECVSDEDHRRHHSNSPERIEKSRAVGKAQAKMLAIENKKYWANKPTMEVACVTCNKSFVVSKHKVKMAKSCSFKCWYKLKKKKLDIS